jgi:hypothetical protein
MKEMIDIQKRKKAFVALGDFLKTLVENEDANDKRSQCVLKYQEVLKEQISGAINYNGWFTEDNIYYSLKTWAEVLSKERIEKWVSGYSFSNTKQKTVGIITAGNIPLVGFHDFVSVLMAGHAIIIKQSSNDQKLLPVLADFLSCIEPQFKELITFQEGKLTKYDAVIATGSNNTARYFEYYFKEHPNIIRKNRNAVAVLTGAETEVEMEGLGEDIFRYFGLGCRSVSKIFVPKGYDFDKLFKALFQYNDIIEYKKYENNYNYNKTVYLMSLIPIIENGFFIIKEDVSYASPIATLFYEYYDSIDQIKNRLFIERDQIQCVVSIGVTKDSIPFGTTQQPQLWDYADGVDTMAFLLDL